MAGPECQAEVLGHFERFFLKLGERHEQRYAEKDYCELGADAG